MLLLMVFYSDILEFHMLLAIFAEVVETVVGSHVDPDVDDVATPDDSADLWRCSPEKCSGTVPCDVPTLAFSMVALVSCLISFALV